MNLSAFFPFGTYGLDLSLPPAHLRTDLWLQLCFFSRVTALSLSFLLLFYLLFLSLFYIFIVLSFFVLQSVCIPSHALCPSVYEALSSTFALPSALPLLFNVQGMQWPRRCCYAFPYDLKWFTIKLKCIAEPKCWPIAVFIINAQLLSKQIILN